MTPQELIDASSALITERQEFDRIWGVISRLVLPLNTGSFSMGVAGPNDARQAVEGWAAGPKSVDELGQRFDTTALVALDRLATGILSLTTPDSEKWQGLGITDDIGGTGEPTDEEKRWLERQRDYLFNVRYNPLSGWAPANQAAIRSMCAYGTGLYLLEEAYGARGKNDVTVPFRSSPLPLSENYLTVDGQGMFDQDFRRFSLSARQLAGLFGESCSAKTLELANDPKRAHQQVQVLHYIGFRKEKGYSKDPMRASPVCSQYMEVNEKNWLRHGGFSYWPVIGYHWNQVPHSAYGESPVMLLLAEIKIANIHGKNELLASQQFTRPPVAMFDDANMAKPNFNPGAINHNALDANGRLKIQAMITARDPGLVQQIRMASQATIKEGLYTNLWQILVNNPKMTATEALIRSNEKGELLGPVGTKIQAGLSALTEAELTILMGKGAWAPGAILEPPQSMAGREPIPQFTSPLDRIRRSSELLGMRQTVEMAGVLADAGKVAALDKIDEDAVLDITQEVTGAPRRMFRSDEAIAKLRSDRAQQQQIAQMTEAARAAGEAGNEAIPAIDKAQKMMAGEPVDA